MEKSENRKSFFFYQDMMLKVNFNGSLSTFSEAVKRFILLNTYFLFVLFMNVLYLDIEQISSPNNRNNKMFKL